MAGWRAAAGTALNVVGAVAGRPANAAVERLQAVALRPVVHRLLDAPDGELNAGVPPAWAGTELTEACKAILASATFGCPTLHVVAAEASPRIETLPIGTWRRSHRIFISKGLLDAGVQRKELRALFARELAHISEGHWHVPRSWTLLQASGVYGVLESASDKLPQHVEQLVRQSWSQLLEICRAHSAVAMAAARARLLPEVVEMLPLDGMSWLELEAAYGDTLTEVCELLEAPTSASVRMQALISLLRRAHVADSVLEPMSSARRPASSSRLKGVMSKQAQIRRMADLSHLEARQVLEAASMGARVLLRRPVMLLGLAVKRTTELAADRTAAEALGSIEPVVAGLVRLHGSKEDQQRIDRGDIQGVIESARAALSARGGMLRWELWWQSLVSGPADPPLVLRVADLAAWAERGEEGINEPWRWTTGRE